jgi:hypothetical protein
MQIMLRKNMKNKQLCTSKSSDDLAVKKKYVPVRAIILRKY